MTAIDAVLGQQQHNPDLQHQGRLVGRRPKHIVEGADAGELAAEDVKRLGGARPRHGRDRQRTGARRDIGNDDRHDVKKRMAATFVGSAIEKV